MNKTDAKLLLLTVAGGVLSALVLRWLDQRGSR